MFWWASLPGSSVLQPQVSSNGNLRRLAGEAQTVSPCPPARVTSAKRCWEGRTAEVRLDGYPRKKGTAQVRARIELLNSSIANAPPPERFKRPNSRSQTLFVNRCGALEIRNGFVESCVPIRGACWDTGKCKRSSLWKVEFQMLGHSIFKSVSSFSCLSMLRTFLFTNSRS